MARSLFAFPQYRSYCRIESPDFPQSFASELGFNWRISGTFPILLASAKGIWIVVYSTVDSTDGDAIALRFGRFQ